MDDFVPPKFLENMGKASVVAGAVLLGVAWLMKQGKKFT